MIYEFLKIFNPKRWQRRTKVKKFINFFILSTTSAHSKDAVYDFIDFRIKRAGTFNYGGAAFCLRQKEASKKSEGERQNYGNSVCHSRIGGNPFFLYSRGGWYYFQLFHHDSGQASMAFRGTGAVIPPDTADTGKIRHRRSGRLRVIK